MYTNTVIRVTLFVIFYVFSGFIYVYCVDTSIMMGILGWGYAAKSCFCVVINYDVLLSLC